MSLLETLILLAIAGLVGALAEFLIGFSLGGMLGAMIVGVVGALIGSWLARLLNLPAILPIQVGTRRNRACLGDAWLDLAGRPAQRPAGAPLDHTLKGSRKWVRGDAQRYRG